MNNIPQSLLLVDGAAAFEEILHCVDTAQKSILINMFIWREDTIGIKLASAVLQAAKRGVHVNISVDRVGMVLERCEEHGRSFFHRKPDVIERLKIAVLKASYPQNCGKMEKKCTCSGLLEEILDHPNIEVEKDLKKSDHSKYYVFDDRVLIFGGINVEDKECGADCAGRVYQDYMLKLEGEECVRAFFDKLDKNLDSACGYRFRMNNKTITPAVFDMKGSFLSVINGAQRELVIVMAYFAPLPEIMHALVEAWKRGVRISILIPENANFQNNSNRKTVHLLMKRCKDGISVSLSPKMVHTKLIASESVIMLGSCNITNLAFSQLGELDIELKNEDTLLIERIRKSVDENFDLSKQMHSYREIKYSPIVAWLEGRFN